MWGDGFAFCEERLIGFDHVFLSFSRLLTKCGFYCILFAYFVKSSMDKLRLNSEQLEDSNLHEYLFSLFEDEKVKEIQEALKVRLALFEEAPRTFARGDYGEDSNFFHKSILDGNPKLVAACIKLYFEQLGKVPNEGEKALSAFDKARKIVYLKHNLNIMTENPEFPYSGDGYFIEKFKSELHLESDLIDSWRGNFRKAIRRVKTIFVKEENKPKEYPYLPQIQALIDFMAQDFKMRATYEQLHDAIKEDSMEAFIEKLTWLRGNRCEDKRFMEIFAECSKYVSSENGVEHFHLLVWHAYKNAFEKYTEEFVKPKVKGPYRG